MALLGEAVATTNIPVCGGKVAVKRGVEARPPVKVIIVAMEVTEVMAGINPCNRGRSLQQPNGQMVTEAKAVLRAQNTPEAAAVSAVAPTKIRGN